MFMQAGFALVETGFTRAKNVAHTMMMNFMVYAIGMTGLLDLRLRAADGRRRRHRDARAAPACSISEFTISLVGQGLRPVRHEGILPGRLDVRRRASFTLFLFQMVFMDTAATIPTGAMAERWKFSSFVVFGFFIVDVHLPDLRATGCGAAAGCRQLGTNFGLGHGHVDFAGSSVVPHGRRRHRAGRRDGAGAAHRQVQQGRCGAPDPGPQHPDGACSGAFILAFGWFGFNPGRTLAGDGPAHRRRCRQHHAGVGVGRDLRDVLHVARSTASRIPSMMVNGMLAGLVAITAPCAFVSSFWAFVIGAVSGVPRLLGGRCSSRP